MPTSVLPDVFFGSVDLRAPVGRTFWFRPDGLWLADVITDTARLGGPHSGDPVSGKVALQRVAYAAAAAAWAPDGKKLALLAPPLPGQDDGQHGLFLQPEVIDTETGQARTFTRVHLSPGSGVAWSPAGGRPSLYAVRADAPNCLLRIDAALGTGETEWCASGERRELIGDFTALPDGRIAVPTIDFPPNVQRGGGLGLFIFDARAGQGGLLYQLFANAGWRLDLKSTGARLPLALSPDGQMLAVLAGPGVDSADTLGDDAGVYVLDLQAGEIVFPNQDPRLKMGWPGLRAAAWSADGRRLAIGGGGRKGPVSLVYDRASNQVRRPPDALGNIAFNMAPHLGNLGYDAWGQEVAILPLAWLAGNPETTNAVGRRLLGLTPIAPNPHLFQPLLVWTGPGGNEANPAVEFPYDSRWRSAAIPGTDLMLRYPGDWAKREFGGLGQTDAGWSAALLPPDYSTIQQPQLPELSVAIWATDMMTGTLRDWLDVHGTAAPFGSAARPEVQFFGLRNKWPLRSATRPAAGEGGGLPALLFEHDILGMQARELLVADGPRVLRIGYADFGRVDVAAAFQQVWQTLTVTQTQALPPGLVYGQGTAAQNDLWRIDDQGKPVRILDRSFVTMVPDGKSGLFVEDDDIWLADLTTGQRRNVTRTPERTEMYPAWWPGRPDTIVFASHPRYATWGSIGLLTAANLSDGAYQILDGRDDGTGFMYGLPAPGPDGQTIAYDRSGRPMLYRWGSGSRPFDLQQYGLQQAVRGMGNPAWSADGKRLVWVATGQFGTDKNAAVVVFDLEAKKPYVRHPHRTTMLEGYEAPPVWQPAGQWLAYAVMGEDDVASGTWVLRADGREEHNLGSAGFSAWSGYGRPVWSPDSKALAVSARSQDGVIRVYDTDTWLARDLVLATPSPSPMGWLPSK